VVATHNHHIQRKEALLGKITICLLTCAFSAIMITELSSTLIIKSHSEQIQIKEEDTPELATKTLIKWFYRQVVIVSFQPITGINFPGTIKKTAIILPAPIHS
jgi:hypothetical protein